jgi:hypothetical protein
MTKEIVLKPLIQTVVDGRKVSPLFLEETPKEI